MFSSTPWLPTALAVTLAVVAAFFFAGGGFLQQHAIAQVPRGGTASRSRDGDRIGVESFRRLARQPRWLLGWALVAAGVVLHVSALLLAPVSVVQPIGVLAVPVAVLLTARAGRVRPPRSVVAGVALAVGGTGIFVLLAGGTAGAASTPATLTGLLIAVAIATAVVVAAELVARARQGATRCVGYASMGAVTYGFGSALIHLVGQATAEGHALLSPLVVTAGLGAAAALTVGAWAVQQAYASGSPAVVIGTLTVGDPLVAILLSAGLLGGGLNLRPLVVVAMLGCAAAAAAGVRLLATHHPAAAPPTVAEPARVSDAVPSMHQQRELLPAPSATTSQKANP